MPCTPSAASASRTLSSRCGWMIAVMYFMAAPSRRILCLRVVGLLAVGGEVEPLDLRLAADAQADGHGAGLHHQEGGKLAPGATGGYAGGWPPELPAPHGASYAPGGADSVWAREDKA